MLGFYRNEINFYPIDPSLVMLVLLLRTPKNSCFHPCMKHTCISLPSLPCSFISSTSQIRLPELLLITTWRYKFVAESISLFCLTSSIQNSRNRKRAPLLLTRNCSEKKGSCIMLRLSSLWGRCSNSVSRLKMTACHGLQVLLENHSDILWSFLGLRKASAKRAVMFSSDLVGTD